MYALDCLFLVTWATLSLGVGMYWYHRGRSLPAGFWLSMVLTPPVSLAIGALLPIHPLRRAQRLAPGGRLRYCPWCQALMGLDGRVCPGCYHAVPTADTAAARSTDAAASPTERLAAPWTEAPQFSVEQPVVGGQRGWTLREVDLLALRVAVARPELVRNPALRTVAAAELFPLDLALYIARRQRGRAHRPTAPIRVLFLDGVIEEYL